MFIEEEVALRIRKSVKLLGMEIRAPQPKTALIWLCEEAFYAFI